MSLLADSAGACLIGVVLSSALSGVALALFGVYARSFPLDRSIFLLLALSMVLMSVSMTCIVTYYLWQMLIVNFENPFYLAEMAWPMAAIFPFAAVSCTTLQFFLAYRAWVLSGRGRGWAIYQLVALALSVASLCVAIYHAQWYARQSSTVAVKERTAPVWTWWGLQITGETAVTASLIYWVIWEPERERPCGPLSSGRIGLLSRFALRAVETNLLSIVFQIAILVLYAKIEQFGLWFVGIGYSVPSLYAISLMLALLSRASEEATFAFEATNSPRLTRAKSFNPSAAVVVGSVNVDVRDQIAVDVRLAAEDDCASLGSERRRPKIKYSTNSEECAEKEEYEMASV